MCANCIFLSGTCWKSDALLASAAVNNSYFASGACESCISMMDFAGYHMKKIKVLGNQILLSGSRLQYTGML